MEKSEELSKARLGYNRDYGPSTDLAAEPKRLKAGETVDEVGMDTSSSSSSVKEDVHMADIGKEKINVGIIRKWRNARKNWQTISKNGLRC
ncbi:hypothetical protein PCASD_26831 [Puccinia coronata f. sp. avenae]|uniref:Uncharacterized protein n=1 Tax=Puccinia coronata f. sp. avenae TaxID=200324 RepID=A0A2N5RUJ6_9BASI|nr:hypothetical protein PCASD_26831 [Puccinia coronata f. sp. avenae]